MGNLKKLVIKYHDSNSLEEKRELRNEIFKNDISENLKIAVIAHYDAFEKSKTKLFKQSMLNLCS